MTRTHDPFAKRKSLGAPFFKNYKMKFLLAGASGFIGTALIKELELRGHSYKKLVRAQPQNSNEIFWDPYKLILDPVDEYDVIINLSGAGIADARWSIARKKILRESRILPTRTLVTAINNSKRKDQIFLSASGAGFYGDTGVQTADESTKIGSGFLAELSREWEEEALQCRTHVALMRITPVIAWNGGIVKKLLLPFKLGLGGKLGTGTQVFSWIALNDLIAAMFFVIDKKLKGSVNFAAPNSISNAEFTKKLAAALNRPAFFHLTTGVIKFIFGELGKEVLLASSDIKPEILLKEGFVFRQPTFKDALVKSEAS